MAAFMIADAEEAHTELLRNIEKARKKMVCLGTSRGLLHPEVVRCSEELDQLLLEYYTLHRTLFKSYY